IAAAIRTLFLSTLARNDSRSHPLHRSPSQSPQFILPLQRRRDHNSSVKLHGMVGNEVFRALCLKVADEHDPKQVELLKQRMRILLQDEQDVAHSKYPADSPPN